MLMTNGDSDDVDDDDDYEILPKFWDFCTQTPNRLPQAEEWSLITEYDDNDSW